MSTISSNRLFVRALATELARSSLAHAFPDRDSIPMELVEPLIGSHIKHVEAALLSLRESHPIENGEGWVLVPREPTVDMLEQGYAAFHALDGHGVPAMMDNAYRAMLEAIPSNPGTSKVENSRST